MKYLKYLKNQNKILKIINKKTSTEKYFSISNDSKAVKSEKCMLDNIPVSASRGFKVSI